MYSSPRCLIGLSSYGSNPTRSRASRRTRLRYSLSAPAPVDDEPERKKFKNSSLMVRCDACCKNEESYDDKMQLSIIIPLPSQSKRNVIYIDDNYDDDDDVVVYLPSFVQRRCSS